MSSEPIVDDHGSDAGGSKWQLPCRILDDVPVMLAYWDANGHCRFANHAYERWFRVAPGSLVGKHLSE